MPRLTEIAHHLVSQVLQPGEAAVDATAGNGFDTLFLARLVGESGVVHAFDVQREAISRTKALLDWEQVRNVVLHHCNHCDLATTLPVELRRRVGAVMFNLGYLPRGDKRIVTTSGTTSAAAIAAVDWIRPGGIVTVVAYRGHPGGLEEAEVLESLLETLPRESYSVDCQSGESGMPTAPILFSVRRTDADVGGFPTTRPKAEAG